MRLNLSPETERYELFPPASQGDPDDPGVVIWARPALSGVVEEAAADDTLLEYGAEVRTIIEAQEAGEDGGPEALRAHGRFGLLLAKAIARRTIERWEGVEDPDGSAAPVTADRVTAFLDHPAIYKAWTETYLARWFALQTEKKGSAPSPNTTSAGARRTASSARKPAGSARGKSTRSKR